MDRKEAIKEFKDMQKACYDGYEPCRIAIESMEKLDKIEQIIDNCDSGRINTEQFFLQLREVLNG